MDCIDHHGDHLFGESLLNKFHSVMELFRITGAVEIKGQILGIDFMLEDGCLGTKCQCSSDVSGVNRPVGRDKGCVIY